MNILSNYIDILAEEQTEYPVKKVYWIKLLDHYKLSNMIGVTHGGAVYSFVFNENQPKENQLPSDFEENVYVGKSGRGCYYDRKNGDKKSPKKSSFLYKRIIHHRDRFNGNCKLSIDEQKKYKLYEDKYGIGYDVLNGTLTGKPLWVGFIPIPVNLPKDTSENWLLRYERFELFRYRKKFNNTPIMNLDEYSSNRKQDSVSSKYEIPDVTSFMNSNEIP